MKCRWCKKEFKENDYDTNDEHFICKEQAFDHNREVMGP